MARREDLDTQVAASPDAQESAGASVGSGRVFQNLADPELQGWADASYGPNYQRLVRVKARDDPANFLHFHQSFPAG